MKLHRIALGILLGSAAAVPAMGQYGASAPAQKPQTPATQATPTAEEGYKPKISSGAAKAILELQTAVNSKDPAAIAAKLPEAEAKAKSKDDRYAIARLKLQAAADAKDMVGLRKAVEEIIATGAVPATDMVPLYVNIGKVTYDEKKFAEASSIFERILQLDPNNRDILLLQAESLAKQGRGIEGLALADRAIAAEKSANGKATEELLRFVFAMAYNNKLPGVTERSLALVSAYPTPTNWRDALRIYQSGSGLENSQLIDIMRLAYVTDALVSESDYYRLANTALLKGFPGEAKAVLESGFAKNAVSRTSSALKPLYDSAVTKSQGDHASLAGAAKTAMAAQTAKQAISIGDAYYGYGDFAEAATLYRAALSKTGADKDLINLHLGMALARSGDKAGAKAALETVGVAQATVAKFWLAYLGA